jgi:shikimate kinase
MARTVVTTSFTGNIFLIGPMGVGKTTIGRALAQQLDKAFFDSDKEIEQRTGANIPLIFEVEGETGFRQREKDMIDELTQKTGIVLATGGGVVLNEQNRKWLRERGWVIYLRAPLEQLLKRTAKNRNRPLLQTENPRQKLVAILEQRNPLYESAADTIIETSGRSVVRVVKDIVRRLPESPLISDTSVS